MSERTHADPSPEGSELELEESAEARPRFDAFPVVGIGASAGGLEAFTQLLSALPEKTGMAYVLIQHLDPKHESRLSGMLDQASRLPVREAKESTKVEQDHVYVIPPGAEMRIEGGVLHLSPRDGGRPPYLTVDTFLRSLARDAQSRAIGVVLSGAGSDGAVGLREIKAEGGITFAQDEESAKYRGMPHSALESGSVDFVLPPHEIAHKLVELHRHPYLGNAAETSLPPDHEVGFQRVLNVMQKRTGVDFRQYRETTIRRRILRRAALQSARHLPEYVQKLEKSEGEVTALYNDILINVTGFFRDPEAFEALKKKVFPEIVAAKPSGEPIRVWCPGCSTGQEAYSLAIALTEFLDDQPDRRIQIFATDLNDEAALERARAGFYPESVETEVGPERLRRFFGKVEHGYRIERVIRDVCMFARQNVVSDPPFSHVDLVSCRNLLIYLGAPLQQRVIPTFHYALNDPGFLFLGVSESVGRFKELFDQVDRPHRIYRKRPMAGHAYPHFRAQELRGMRMAVTDRPQPLEITEADFLKEADRLLLGRFSPPGVVVNENLEIIQFRGRTLPFLEAPTGIPTTNILKMAREGLFLELRSALEEVKRLRSPVRREGVRIQEVGPVDLEIFPLSYPGSREAKYLVLFSLRGAGAEPAPAPARAPDRPAEAPHTGHEDADRDNADLRRELTATKEYLNALIEQQDAINEELRSANEEILSSNEELQSTNEELETAKEELESTNEELTTVNEQLHHRNQEVTVAHGDMSNLIASTAIPVVMIGADQRIRSFTPSAERVMHLRRADIGRPIGEVRQPIDSALLKRMVSEVIETAQPAEREVRDAEGRWNVLRVVPYHTADNRTSGAVILLVDIDQSKRTQSDLELQTTLVNLSHDAIIVMDEGRRVVSWNRGAEEMYGWTREEALGKRTHQLLHTSAGMTVAEIDAQLHQTGTWEGQIRHRSKDGIEIIVDSRQVLVRMEPDKPAGILEINRDITRQLLDDARLQQQSEALRQADRRKDEFLAMLAHELRNPLAPVRNAVRILRLAGENPELLGQAHDVLERQVEQLARIVDDLLDMTRVAEGKIEMRKERLKLSSVVQTAIESSRSLIESRAHKLSMNFPAEPLYLEADPVRVAQVLTNLLNNAAKFTEPGGEITLDIEHESGRGKTPGTVAISVKDSGIGMAPELLPHIWEMFVQGDRSLERVRGGLGVGLTLVRSLVAAHGGTVEAKSKGLGKGSTFTVRLPLSTPPRTAEEGAAAPAKPARIPRRILVVDDNRDQAESLGMLLEVFGHRVRIAFDGPQALEAATTFQPQVILLDIGLPGMNGYELAKRIRERPDLKDVLLIAQTGWGEDTDRRRSAEAGFDRHLVKPVDIKILEQLLADLKAPPA